MVAKVDYIQTLSFTNDLIGNTAMFFKPSAREFRFETAYGSGPLIDARPGGFPLYAPNSTKRPIIGNQPIERFEVWVEDLPPTDFTNQVGNDVGLEIGWTDDFIAYPVLYDSGVYFPLGMIPWSVHYDGEFFPGEGLLQGLIVYKPNSGNHVIEGRLGTHLGKIPVSLWKDPITNNPIAVNGVLQIVLVV